VYEVVLAVAPNFKYRVAVESLKTVRALTFPFAEKTVTDDALDVTFARVADCGAVVDTMKSFPRLRSRQRALKYQALCRDYVFSYARAARLTNGERVLEPVCGVIAD
jgi:hypothetical protein